jgi:hypothetical protein
VGWLQLSRVFLHHVHDAFATDDPFHQPSGMASLPITPSMDLSENVAPQKPTD